MYIYTANIIWGFTIPCTNSSEALFFGNLRANCEERYRAFLPRGRL